MCTKCVRVVGGCVCAGACALGVLTLSACEEQGPAERAGENIDKAAKDVGESIEEAGEDLKKSTDGK